MNVGQVIAEVMKREDVDILFTYPLNPLTEFAAAIDIGRSSCARSALAAPWPMP